MRLGAGAQAWAGGRAGRWAQARVAGVRTGAQGVLALGVGAGARAAGGRRWGAQARGRASGRAAGRAGVRLGARCARGTASRQYGRAACGCRLGQLGQVGVLCTRLGFQPVFFDSVFFLSH